MYQFTFTTPLADGLHHLNAEVQMVDPALPTHQTGFGPMSTTSLDITVDTVAPPVSFGTSINGNNGLDAGSDSGPTVDQPTLTDRVTNDTTPTFYGTAEANSIIRVYAVGTAPGPNFGQNILIGQTVATPLDGTNALADGRWSVTSNVSLDDPQFFALDGTRTILVTAEDVAGNVSAPSTMHIFLDTQGPNIAGVQITGSPTFNLFAFKPTNFTQGPTPLVHSLTILVSDLPNRDGVNFPNYVALDKLVDEKIGLFSVVGDQSGVIPISKVTITNNPPINGLPATATIQLDFSSQLPQDNGALPDDRYTLTISDSVVDPANNKLDGESNANLPSSIPSFPSGNGVPGGNFVARFTVDSRPHIGIYGNGVQQLDINGNGFWDPVNAHDAVNSDLAFAFGRYTDNLFAGNLAPAGTNGSGFDTLGAYGVVNGQFRWLLTFNGVASPDYSVVSGLQINGLPVAGRFNPAINADEIAVFDGHGNWYIDINHTNNLGADALVISDGLRGYPVVGDFDGNGQIDLATYQPDTNTWQFDLNPLGDNHVLTSFAWGFPGILERPVAADMNRDGVTDIGLFVPTTLHSGMNPGGVWYFLESNLAAGAAVPGTISALAHVFNPSPFTSDVQDTFGNGFFQPIVGPGTRLHRRRRTRCRLRCSWAIRRAP